MAAGGGSLEGGSWGSWEELGLCFFFQQGCCTYGSACYFKHDGVEPDSGERLVLCAEFHRAGSCSRESCPDAHGMEELRTPSIYSNVPGYKACLCTFYMFEDLQCGEELCFEAHGLLDLRRRPPTKPPEALLDEGGTPSVFCDAHVHLDHVLMSRRYGSTWFYKRSRCKFKVCKRSDCAWVHGESDRRPRPPMKREMLEEWANEVKAIPSLSFGGLVHSCCDVECVEETVRLVQWGRELLDGQLYVAFGIHPTCYETYTPEVEARLLAATAACGRQCVAWGECGLDFYRRWTDVQAFPDVQREMQEVFARQAKLAVRLGLPLVVHSRDAEEETLAVLREHVPLEHPVYLHSFMGTTDAVLEFLDTWKHSCIGIAGCLTYPTGGNLTGLVGAVPLERLLLETDGPYMAPVPFRGEESHPGQIPWIAEAVAKVKGVPTSEVLATVHSNFRRFYRV